MKQILLRMLHFHDGNCKDKSTNACYRRCLRCATQKGNVAPTNVITHLTLHTKGQLNRSVLSYVTLFRYERQLDPKPSRCYPHMRQVRRRMGIHESHMVRCVGPFLHLLRQKRPVHTRGTKVMYKGRKEWERRL